MAVGSVFSEWEDLDRVSFMFYTVLKELDSTMEVMAIKYQYSWLTSRPKSSVCIFKLDSSLNTRTSPLYTYRNFQLATQAQAPY